MSDEQIPVLAAQAREAQRVWEMLGFKGRAKLLGALQKAVIDEAEALIDVIVSESGKTRDDALTMEIAYTVSALAFWRAKGEGFLKDERIRSRSPFAVGRRLAVRYEPYGLVGVIAPWNYPLANAIGDCIPALLAGNAVILKPSPVTPLTAIAIAKLAHRCGVPEEVFQVACGEAETAEALIDAVDFVMFTGSTATGKKVMERASRTLTPVSLELGGKDPMIVLADADLERAASYAIQYGMCNAGQTCIAVERVYVERPVYDEFTALLKDKAQALRLGSPGAYASVDVGPLTTSFQADIVERHVNDARDKGATVLTGGQRDGNFFQPTILTDVNNTMACMQEETFGPTLAVMAADNAEQAIALANDSRYGLTASVYGRDKRHAEAVARQLEAGTVSVNDTVTHFGVLDLPMGGWKQSGLGSRHGVDGIRKYTRRQSICVVERSYLPNFHFFPNTLSASKINRRMLKLLFGRG
jgi:acyl-CoA reductase-like NAD-dependent aldehyde dehydrogenase